MNIVKTEIHTVEIINQKKVKQTWLFPKILEICEATHNAIIMWKKNIINVKKEREQVDLIPNSHFEREQKV